MQSLRLQDKAYSFIRKLIVDGGLSAGDFISEGQLVNRLGMSRTPIRSALHRLEQEGLVRIFPKQGVYIPEISVAQIHEMYDLRIALETFAVRRLSQQQNQQTFNMLRTILELQKMELEKMDTTTFMIQDTRFHLSIVGFLENRELMMVFQRNEDKLLMFGREIFKRDIRRLESSYREHNSIVDEMVSAHVQNAVQQMEEHLIRGRSVLLNGGS